MKARSAVAEPPRPRRERPDVVLGDVARAGAAQQVLEQDLDGVREPVELGDRREPVQLDRTVAGLQSGPGSERVAHGSMLSDASAKLGDRLAVRDPRLAPDLRPRAGGAAPPRSRRSAAGPVSACPRRRARRTRGTRWRSGSSCPSRAPRIRRGRRSRARSSPRRSRTPSRSRCRRRGLGARNDISSIETVTHMPAGVLERGEPRRRVDELHHDAAVDDPGDVGVGDLHQLDERHLARRHPSGFEIVHVRDSRRRGAGSMPACVASSPSSWSSPWPVRPVRVRTSPPLHPPGRPLRRPRDDGDHPVAHAHHRVPEPRAPLPPWIPTSGSPKACRRSWTTPPTSR